MVDHSKGTKLASSSVKASNKGLHIPKLTKINKMKMTSNRMNKREKQEEKKEQF